MTLYAQLRQRKLVRIREHQPDCPKLAQRVTKHPEFAAIKTQLRAGFQGRAHRQRWLNTLNFHHPFKHRLSWVHINAYLEWVARSYGKNPPPVGSEPVLVAIGAGDKSSSGRGCMTITPAYSDFERCHGIELGGAVIPLTELNALIRQAPEPARAILSRLCSGRASEMPLEPTDAILEAVEWLGEWL